MKTTLASIVLALSLSGCFVLDDEHIRELETIGLDSGPPSDDSGMEVDAGGEPTLVDDECGVASPRMLLAQTTRNIHIDTVGLSNSVTSNCGGAQTLGNDAYIAIDVQPGVYWHFHLRNDPTDPDSANRQPALYMLFAPGGSCDARDCRFNSDVCGANGDEHFGFVADAAGRWYLGIDDRQTGGGRYLLDAIRPTCGDTTRDHGEACDDGNTDDGDGCSSRCLRELTSEIPAEIEANDNPTEANFLVMGAATEFTTNGDIGGPGACRYSDTFAIDVPMGARVEVDVLNSDGTICNNPALSADYALVLRNAAFTAVVNGMVDSNGCATVRSSTLAGGLYYVSVTLPQEIDRGVSYSLRVRLM